MEEESGSVNPYTANAAITRDVYNCSEYERAAHAISFVRRSLDTLPSNAAVPGHGALLRQLDQRCHQLAEQLITRLRVRLSAMFAEDSSPSKPLAIYIYLLPVDFVCKLLFFFSYFDY